jgi:hypothetical protein
MKTIRITLEKPGAKAVLHHVYRTDDFPQESRWTGDKQAFTAPSGRVPGFADGLDNLEATVAYQAALCGASYRIDDLGGGTVRWIDTVEP